MAKKALVVIENNQALTTSRLVAEKFDKNHQHVMRDIRRISTEIDPSKFGQMFFETTLPDQYGREQPAYLIDRDGFSLLAMGFTGEKALQFKLKFINAFNKMEARLAALTPDERERLKIRQAGKVKRRALTDAIKPFEQRERPKSAGKYYALPTKFIQSELCGIPNKGRDTATGQQLLLCALLESAGSNTFNRDNLQGKSYKQAFEDVKTTTSFLKRVFEGEVPLLH